MKARPNQVGDVTTPATGPQKASWAHFCGYNQQHSPCQIF